MTREYLLPAKNFSSTKWYKTFGLIHKPGRCKTKQTSTSMFRQADFFARCLVSPFCSNYSTSLRGLFREKEVLASHVLSDVSREPNPLLSLKSHFLSSSTCGLWARSSNRSFRPHPKKYKNVAVPRLATKGPSLKASQSPLTTASEVWMKTYQSTVNHILFIYQRRYVFIVLLIVLRDRSDWSHNGLFQDPSKQMSSGTWSQLSCDPILVDSPDPQGAVTGLTPRVADWVMGVPVELC